ncbi:MAG: hypothetical protein WAL90_06965 [Desulfobacterales bacterium]
MLKFIPGILLLQVITIGLVLTAPGELQNWGWLRVAVPVVIAGLLTAFWFGSIAAHQRKDDIGRLKEQYAREREAIRVNAERAKTRLVKQAHQETLQAVRRSDRRANIKVGLAFAGAAGVGGFLILMQFMSLGLLTLAGAGGALGGYLWRSRQEKNKLNLPRGMPHTPVIGAPPQRPKQITDNEPRP